MKKIFLLWIIFLLIISNLNAQDPDQTPGGYPSPCNSAVGGVEIDGLCFDCGNNADGICPDEVLETPGYCESKGFPDADCAPAVPPCDLTSASWSPTSTTEGTSVSLNVQGTNCGGKIISFEIREDDGTGWTFGQSVTTNPVNVGFGTPGAWTAEWQSDISGDPEYFFRASVVGTNEYVQSSDPKLSVTKACVPSGSCASSTCVGSTCPGPCGNVYSGTLEPNCGARECGPVPNGCGVSCGDCIVGESCNGDGQCTTDPVAFWSDGVNQINTLEVIVEETSVSMVLENSGLSSGTSVSFEIYEKNFIGKDDIRTGASAIPATVDINGKATAQWTIIQEDLDKTKDDYDKFYFKVNGKESNQLALTILECGGITLCRDYTAKGKTVCEVDKCGVAAASQTNPDVTCDDGYICSCTWLNSACGPSWVKVGEENYGICNYLESDNDINGCDDGYLSYSWDVSIDWPEGNLGWADEASCISNTGEGCQKFNRPHEINDDLKWHYDPNRALYDGCTSGQRTIKCPAQIPLSFFGVYNVISILVLIILIYVLLILKKKKKVKKKRK